MIAKRSPLDLAEFTLINQQYKFTAPKDESIDIMALMFQYTIDIDFSINTRDDIHFQLRVAIAINQNSKLPGYTMLSEGVGFFDFSKAGDLSTKQKGEFLQFSGISICINQLRSIIGSLSVNGPFGKYLLPAIDVNDLLNKKVKAIANSSAKPKKKERKISSKKA